MKRLLLLLLVLVVLLAGCGKMVEKLADDAVGTMLSSEDVKVEVDSSSGEGATVITTDEGKIEVSSDENASVAIPKGYPEDILPIYAKDKIVMAADYGEDGFTIVGQTQDDMATVVKFYEDVLVGAESTLVQNFEGMHMSMGVLEGMNYNVQVSEEESEDYTSFSLILVPAE
ncbi:conserved exported protein of unknown function [Petrocella atlantisensis]|uniref:Lipoprotein n=1 Tax=Petrocella atlantisensis TaxID=2173034 RepID=A0A3P7NX90_9FIRM|nr:hypothetical protein [Petrocella atlantisensis]VDN47595.1 conserved exported protein of unknown function [Petrocella atlantisensis]